MFVSHVLLSVTSCVTFTPVHCSLVVTEAWCGRWVSQLLFTAITKDRQVVGGSFIICVMANFFPFSFSLQVSDVHPTEGRGRGPWEA